MSADPGTTLTVPAELLEPGTEYEFEVLAIAENGNQTITETCFVPPTERPRLRGRGPRPPEPIAGRRTRVVVRTGVWVGQSARAPHAHASVW